MRDAYLIENGQITEPLREGNLIGNGPQVLSDIDMLGTDFSMGGPVPVVRTAKSPGRYRSADPSCVIDDDRRDGCVSESDSNSELFALADSLIDTANSSEQIEVYISRGSSTGSARSQRRC